MRHRTKDEAPIVAATTTGASVDMNSLAIGQGTAPFSLATDTSDSLANRCDSFARGRYAVQGA